MKSDSTAGNHLHDDEILDLVLGFGSADARARWLGHAAACGECRASLEASRETHRTAQAEWSAARECLAARAPARGGAGRAVAGHGRLLAGAAVAAAAALVVLAIWGPPRGAAVLHAIPLRPLPAKVQFTTLRDTAGALRRSVRDGVEAYARRDYAEAADHLRGGDAKDPSDDLRRIYLGSALAFLGRDREAAAILDSVDPDRIPEPWKSEVMWSLASVQLALGNVARADSLVTALTSGRAPDTSRTETARATIRRLVRGSGP